MCSTVMNTNKIFNIIAAAAVSFSLVGCTAKFAEISKDHYNAHEKEMTEDNLLLGSMFQQLERSVIVYSDGTYLDSDYQIMYGLCAETWCGYTAPTLSDGKNSGFLVTDGWHRRMFTVKYEYGMAAYTKLAEFAKENNLDAQLALGKILKVATMHQVTDYYGPIAYSQTGSVSGNLYDSQEEVYKAFFTELGEAIDVLTPYATAGTTIMEDYDLVYGGDLAKWVRFANSLRLRLAMRIAYADATLAQAEAEKSIAHTLGVITDNADNAVVSGVGHHPIYEINVNFNDADCQINATMDCYLNGYNDPRKNFYVKNAGDGNIHGVRTGFAPSDWSPYKNTAAKVSAPNASIYNICWLNAAEVAFLRAEGAVRGWNMGGTASNFYADGVALSFDEWGATGAATYLANSTSKPAAFQDAVGSNNTSAPSEVTIAWNEGGSLEEKLEKIGTQKWLALFPNGAEAWAEYRRLHYPKILKPVKNFNSDVNDDQQIRRVPYPVSEQSDNAEGYASGVAALGGADNAGTRLWWDKKPF